MIVKLGKSSNLKIPEEILEELTLKEGDYLDCIVFKNTIHLLPIRLNECPEPILDTIARQKKEVFCSESSPSQIHVTLFREFNVMAAGEFLFIKNKKAKELLAYLLAHNGTPFNKPILPEILWPQTPREKAMDNLYKVIRYLKNTPPLNTYFPLHASHGKIQLDTSNINCDTYLFEKYYKARSNIEQVKMAVELYQGSFLFEEYYEWTAQKEAYFEIRYIEMLELLILHFKQEGNHTLAYYYRQKLNSDT